jgi:hypothetical protein
VEENSLLMPIPVLKRSKARNCTWRCRHVADEGMSVIRWSFHLRSKHCGPVAKGLHSRTTYYALQHPVNSPVSFLHTLLYCFSIGSTQTARFEKAERARPAPIIISPISAIMGSELAVCGKGSAAGCVAAAAGGGSTT